MNIFSNYCYQYQHLYQQFVSRFSTFGTKVGTAMSS
jgi:hypothetical protein